MPAPAPAVPAQTRSPQRDRPPRWPRQPEVEHRKRESQRHSNAARNPRPLSHEQALRRGRRQQSASRIDNGIDADLQHPLVGLGDASMRSRARRIAQHNTARSIRPIARRIRRPEDRHDRNLQRRRQMQRPSISANEHPRPPRECNQLGDRTLNRIGCPFTRSLGLARQLLFPRTAIQNRPQSTCSQRTSHAPVPLRWPAFRSPSRPRIQNRKVPRAADALINAPLSRSVRWELHPRDTQPPLRHALSDG